MKIVNTGSSYRVYDDDSLRTLDQLPAGTYSVRFDDRSGFYLTKRPDLVVNEKIYGNHMEKAEKVIKSFSAFNRNMGVILSGAKGIGKSICAKLIANLAIENNIPVILIDKNYEDLSEFLNQIRQEVMILFDEFDKVFDMDSKKSDHIDGETQASLLTMFDGTSVGKKLFVVTCNSHQSLSNFILNRPGRFHYHIRFGYPNADEVRSYMFENVDKKYHDEIEDVVSFTIRADINYDCLRAIAFELNSGIPFSEAIRDLNITNTEISHFDLYLRYDSGLTLSAINVMLDVINKKQAGPVRKVWFEDTTGASLVRLAIDGSDIKFSPETGFYINKEDIKICETYIPDEDWEKELCAKMAKINKMKPAIVQLVRRPTGADDIHFKV